MVWNHPEQFEDGNDKSLDMETHNGSETESVSTPGLNSNDTRQDKPLLKNTKTVDTHGIIKMENFSDQDDDGDNKVRQEYSDINPDELLPKENARSLVWKYFGFIPDPAEAHNIVKSPLDPTTPTCRLCGRNIRAKGDTKKYFKSYFTIHIELGQNIFSNCSVVARPRNIMNTITVCFYTATLAILTTR